MNLPRQKIVRDVVVSGSFDDLRSRPVRLLQEASKLGGLKVFLWSDQVARSLLGRETGFPEEERRYCLEAIRYVSDVTMVTDLGDPDALPVCSAAIPGLWAVEERDDTVRKREFARSLGIDYRVFREDDLKLFPAPDAAAEAIGSDRTRVVVTGCYDWLHSGHVRFFEEAAGLGELYVVLGHDANLRMLKGEGHPMFPQGERQYMVQAVRYVHRAMIASGSGWLDAEPEIGLIRPGIYLVNEDGDRPEKRAFCESRGIRYVVLKRVPRQGLQSRKSTELRGF